MISGPVNTCKRAGHKKSKLIGIIIEVYYHNWC